MTSMVSSLYDALRSADVTEEKARRAAEDVADYQNQFHGIERDLTSLKGEVGLLKWMVGFNLALTTAVLFRLFS